MHFTRQPPSKLGSRALPNTVHKSSHANAGLSLSSLTSANTVSGKLSFVVLIWYSLIVRGAGLSFLVSCISFVSVQFSNCLLSYLLFFQLIYKNPIYIMISPFKMFKLDLEKAEEPEIKLSTSTDSLKKQENTRKTSTSALFTMPKPLTVWITTNCRKFLKRWKHQTTWPASWEICIQVKRQQLELDMELQTVPNWERSTSRLYTVTLLI